MTLEIPGAKITVESTHERYEFQTASAQIGSLTGGRTHFLSVGDLYGKKKTPLPEKEEAPVIENATLHKLPVDHEKQAAFNAVRRAAQQIERVTLANARDIERAIASAQSTADSADHQLNMTVLEALHSGVTAQELQDILTHLGFPQLTGTVDDVYMLNVDDLYVTEA